MVAKVTSNRTALLHEWSRHPDITNVSAQLSKDDEALFAGIGRILARTGQTSRFAVTLLHSHFEVRNDEILIESREASGHIITEICRFDSTVHAGLTLRSWAFKERPADGDPVNLTPLTMVRKDELNCAPLIEQDTLLLQALASHFRVWDRATQRFGMALVGNRPEPGMVWTEGTIERERVLIQEQLREEEVNRRDPIRTMWTFAEDGSRRITMGCCVQGPSNRGHTGTRHPWGVTL